MTIDGLVIQGQCGRILGTWFRTDGEKRPLVLLCHGIPGNDQLHDFAYDLQASGYHVISFNYRGSWGSSGDYSLHGVLEDTSTMLDWILSRNDPAVDTDRIYLLGHSLGGFATLNTYARRPEIAAAALISPANMTDMYEAGLTSPEMARLFRTEMDDFCRQLDGVTSRKLFDEIARDGETFRFENTAAGIGTRPTLVIGGTRDDITPAPLCSDKIAQILSGIPGSHCERELYDAPHDYLNMRPALRHRVLTFFNVLTH